MADGLVRKGLFMWKSSSYRLRAAPGKLEESAGRVGTGLEGRQESLGIRSFEARIGGFRRGTVGGVRRLRDEMRLLGNLSGAAGG